MEILSPKKYLSTEQRRTEYSTSSTSQQPQKQTGKEQTAKALENAVGPKYVELIVNNKNNDAVYNTTGVDTKPQFPGGISDL
jgi:hypothetical protein